MGTNNSWNSANPVEVAKGGTNATSMATNTGIVKFDGTRLVTSSTALIDASNRYTNTSQPMFLAYLNTDVTNATGDGTRYQVVYDTEVSDIGANFSTVTGAFTAPVAGIYKFSHGFTLSNLSAGVIVAYSFFYHNATTYYQCCQLGKSGGSSAGACGSLEISMAAGQTMAIVLNAISGTKTATVNGVSANDRVNWFSGVLLT